MNILIPHSWLLEHLETTASPEEIQRLVSLSGPSVERIHDIEGEPVYDIEVTTNRVDSMSVRGIAREAAVILTQAGIKSKLKAETGLPGFIGKSKKSESSLPLPKVIENQTLCPRIAFMVISNVERISSPEWMQIRLKQIGINPHDAVIDITNYVTHELGHPCHAFDYDRIMELGGVIKVTTAQKGLKFTTLDGEKHETIGGEIVFTNQEGEIIDLPGIKGTQNSSITSSTKNVLLWIESIDPKLVRFASMSHAIRTVAAQLNEKGVDSELIPTTLAKGLELFSQLAHGQYVEGSYTDLNSGEKKPVTIEVTGERINEYLGVSVESDKVISILTALGCESSLVGKKIRVIPPSHRPDLEIPEDVIEEIARIYGYHNLPSVLMSSPIPLDRPTDTNFTLELDAKKLLAALGGYEVYTYSMIDEAMAQFESQYILSGLQTKKTDLNKTHLKLKNPLTEDLVYLRRTLWVSHAKIIVKQNTPFVFELANTYIPPTTSGLPAEELHLTITTNKDERKIKGLMDSLLAMMYLPQANYKAKSGFEAEIYLSDALIGSIVALPNPQLYAIDLNWKALVALARKYPLVKAIPKVSAIIEDMTFSLTQPIEVQTVLDTIKNIDPLISKVSFKDQFKNNFTFTVYYQPETEMSTTEISPYRKRIVDALRDLYNAKIVGQI